MTEQARRDDIALGNLFNHPPPPPPAPPGNGLREAAAHEQRIREVEIRAEQERLLELRRQEDKRASMAQAFEAALQASMTEAARRAEAQAAEAQRQIAAAAAAQQQAHEAHLQRIEAERRAAQPPATEPQRVYIGDRRPGNRPVDTTRTPAAKRKKPDTAQDEQPSRARPRPALARPPSPQGTLQPTMGVMSLDLPTSLGRPNPKRRAGYVPGDTTRTAAAKRPKPDFSQEEQPARPRQRTAPPATASKASARPPATRPKAKARQNVGPIATVPVKKN